MKKIDIIVVDHNTLRLNQDAQTGDIIDLRSVEKFDLSAIDKLIEEGKEVVYNQKLEEARQRFELESQNKILELENQYELKIKDLDKANFSSKTEMEDKYKKQMADLELQIKELENNNNLVLEKQRLEMEKEFNLQLSSKNQELAKLKYEWQIKEGRLQSNFDLEKQKQINQFENDKIMLSQKLEKEYKDKLLEKDEIINKLQRQKANLNVKQTGEDLEAWCDREVISYMQNGLLNCTWQKDNEIVQDELDKKGSKADFIFSIYATAAHTEKPLAQVCLEMKDENPDSVNKKKNSDHYKQLDNNRRKKGCKYALLVSNLELDKPNDLPIYRVNEYEDMYVVRPAYMMTFLNILTSLTLRFIDLINKDKKESEELAKQIEFNQTFEELKKTYLDKPLESLTKKIEDIRKQNEAIFKASNSISNICDEITRSYLLEIEQKLDKFDLKISRAYRVYNKG